MNSSYRAISPAVAVKTQVGSPEGTTQSERCVRVFAEPNMKTENTHMHKQTPTQACKPTPTVGPCLLAPQWKTQLFYNFLNSCHQEPEMVLAPSHMQQGCGLAQHLYTTHLSSNHMIIIKSSAELVFFFFFFLFIYTVTMVTCIALTMFTLFISLANIYWVKP